ncbi:zinc finger and BTB domain-containing protein 5-like [Salarias fasciatus]|uniref:zinc finger and BTB domain-containing protein 5-like n=1 Tax=Salarias fasciatus TaxID=181472 RepID=UPI0011769172|nr:zinc finger and BTB domain-containing protein 5-like [Salarias fasciatus]
MDFPGHFQHIFQQLNHQRLHAQLCDCVVVVGGQTFQAHRSILAACSSHFRALLNSSDEMEGSGGDGGRDGGPSVLTLDPGVVTPEAFSTLLDMIYTSTLSLGASNVMDVLLAASHLHLNTVVKACKLHLARKNFPAAPPKGWRSVQQQQQTTSSQAASTCQQQVSSVMVVDLDKEEVGVEVSQSGGDEESEVRIIDDEPPAAASRRRKRKSQEDMLCDRKRTSKTPGENYKECSPTVTRSVFSTEEGHLLSPDCLMSIDRLWENQAFDTNEVKDEAEKGESDEMQLPSQSDSSVGGAGVWESTNNTDGGFVVKIKVVEEETRESKMNLIEVKTENTSLYSSDLDTLTKSSPPLPLQDCTDNLDGNLGNEKMTTISPVEADVSSLQTQLCTDIHTDAHKSPGDLGEDSVDGEGLESLSELAFTCFLNPSSESVMGGLEEEDSLASLTAAATAAAAASDAHVVSTDPSEHSQKTEGANTPSAQSSDSSSSLVFPVASVPLQQLLPEQSPNFSDTIILQPAQNPLTGFLSGIRPGLTLEASLVPSPRAGKSSGATTTFRRIAPKVPPGSETSTDPSSGSTGDAVDRPPLTRASEDVLSKCKKAAAEDHVLLVEGEKKYACKICCKTFMNLTDCKKHIRVHTGEKPYPCPNCGKRFSQSSHLYKHSKNTCLNWKDDQSFSDTLLLPADLVKDSN